jgi:hypothetical protein
MQDMMYKGPMTQAFGVGSLTHDNRRKNRKANGGAEKNETILTDILDSLTRLERIALTYVAHSGQ